MNRSIDDVRSDLRRLASSKPVYAAAGAGVLASQRLRELPALLARLREEATAGALPTRATEYVHTARARAIGEYDRLAGLGKKVIAGTGSGGGTTRSSRVVTAKRK
jgi:hypothetical protein